MKLKVQNNLEWEDICKGAKIRMKSWMTGIPGQKPTDEEVHKLADFLHSTFEWIKYGEK